MRACPRAALAACLVVAVLLCLCAPSLQQDAAETRAPQRGSQPQRPAQEAPQRVAAEAQPPATGAKAAGDDEGAPAPRKPEPRRAAGPGDANKQPPKATQAAAAADDDTGAEPDTPKQRPRAAQPAADSDAAQEQQPQRRGTPKPAPDSSESAREGQQAAPAGSSKADKAAGSDRGQPNPPKPSAAPVPAKKSKIVDVAPEAEVQNDDDIDVTGKCAGFLSSSSCKDTAPGDGAVAECISDLMAAAEAGDGHEKEVVPEECQEDVYQFMIARGKNINANLPLARACKADAERLCNNTWMPSSQDGSIIECLREQKEQLSRACAKEVFLVQQAIARDYRADPAMATACKEDVEQYCKNVKDGGGRKSACLRDNRDKLSPACNEEVFRQQLESEEDIRLNVRLFQKCLADKKQFCADVPPSHSAARDCLIDHRLNAGFSTPCREELEAMVEARVRDFRVDSRLRKVCAVPLRELCGGMEAYDGDETQMNFCLQDFIESIQDEACKSMVYEYQKLAAQDIRFDVPLADACIDDRTKFCSHVAPGSARVIRCLQNSREKLSGLCRAVLFDEEVKFSENIDFQFPMKQACTQEIELFCKDVPHGNARVIRCLQHNKDAKEFGKACLKEVTQYESRASQDYQLNFRLKKQCKKDIDVLCKDACRPDESQVCGGTMLRCLTDNRDQIKSEACAKEVLYFQKMEVSNFHNDVILAAQCRADVDKFCKDVPPGQGRVHACLRQHRKEISDGCRREEMLLEQQEAEHIELRPNLLKACADERQHFCMNVQAGSGRVFRCLAEKLADPDFGNQCRKEVILKLQRRQANWRLDPPLRRACRSDVADMCKAEDSRSAETGEVYRCLIHNYEDLDPGCRKELGRAVHMAFFIWAEGAVLTSPCDGDVAALCLKNRPNMDHLPGAVGSCLADILERIQAAEATGRRMGKDKPAPGAPPAPQLSEQCRVLADVAEPPNMKRAFETTLSVALLESQLSGLEAKTGLAMVRRDPRSGKAQALTLTGWTAIAGIAAMVALALAGGVYAYKRYTGVPLDSTTVVLKTRPRYNRVAGSE